MRGRIPGYILFDLDGTLIDTTVLHLRAFQHAFSRHLGKTIPDEQILARLGMPLKEHLACFSP